jgi:hypothetical protein
MKIEVSNGEIVDKITILKIKSERISETDKLKNINDELNTLLPTLVELNIDEHHHLFVKLYNVNSQLWEVEDTLREMEYKKIFDDIFIQSARRVYYLNDERAMIKKQINIITHSQLIEEKSYQNYT